MGKIEKEKFRRNDYRKKERNLISKIPLIHFKSKKELSRKNGNCDKADYEIKSIAIGPDAKKVAKVKTKKKQKNNNLSLKIVSMTSATLFLLAAISMTAVINGIRRALPSDVMQSEYIKNEQIYSNFPVNIKNLLSLLNGSSVIYIFWILGVLFAIVVITLYLKEKKEKNIEK